MKRPDRGDHKYKWTPLGYRYDLERYIDHIEAKLEAIGELETSEFNESCCRWINADDIKEILGNKQ